MNVQLIKFRIFKEKMQVIKRAMLQIQNGYSHALGQSLTIVLNCTSFSILQTHSSLGSGNSAGLPCGLVAGSSVGARGPALA